MTPVESATGVIVTDPLRTAGPLGRGDGGA